MMATLSVIGGITAVRADLSTFNLTSTIDFIAIIKMTRQFGTLKFTWRKTAPSAAGSTKVTCIVAKKIGARAVQSFVVRVIPVASPHRASDNNICESTPTKTAVMPNRQPTRGPGHAPLPARTISTFWRIARITISQEIDSMQFGTKSQSIL